MQEVAMMHDWNGGWGAGTWLLMGFGMLVFWTLIALTIMWIVRSIGDRRLPIAPPPGHGSQDMQMRSTARQILDERFARGEIDDEEYHRRVEALGGR
jgi:putative membrane protein